MNATALLQLFTAPKDPSLLTYGVYDPALVILSILIAIFASWMGLQLAGQATAVPQLRRIVLLTGSLALGSGVWAMHFIGMLAFNLCTRVDYDPAITLVSLVPSVAASFVALLLIGRQRLSNWNLLTGGVLVGAGIGAMHYTGMASMRMNLALRYDPWMFGLSIVVAVVLATLALWVRFGLRGLGGRIKPAHLLPVSAVVMGCAIAGMHYTGMAAARFVGRLPPGSTGSSNGSFVALAITLITVAFTIFVLATNGWLGYRQMFRHLSRSEAWMRALLTTTVDGVITVGADGTIVEFNAAAERIFGWPRADIVGLSIATLVADPDRSTQDGILRIVQAGDPGPIGASSEVLGRRRDGSTVPIRRAIGHARLGDQDLFVCFITDISERRAIEQALRESELQFRSLIGNIPGISFRCLLADGYPLVFVSDAVERVSGHPAADFLGSAPRVAFRDLVLPDDYARVRAVQEQAVRAGESYLVEYRLLHADGSLRWLWENGAVVRNDEGRVQWLDGVILDISERRQMEEDLRLAKETAEQAAAARAAFVANMSHEIRTPMNSILGFTDVLLDTELSVEQRRHLDTVRKSGRSLLRLLNEVLDTAKLDKGAVELESVDYNLLALIDELASTMGSNARAKGLRMDIRYDPALPVQLRGDELRVRQVLVNLLDNAIKFTAEGSVTLGAGLREGQLHFLIRDTGIGIAQDRLDSIFEPFTQADASMTRRFGGTGLGTTISKQLVELMGGRIWAESAAGVGTSFHVLLPLVKADMAADAGPGGAALELPPLRVLAADDVPQNLELLKLMLTRRGHRMIAASDGAVAVDLAAREDFDLILMDVQMPQMDGLAATRAIRAAAARTGRRRVPIIAMTASVLQAHRLASAEAGMDGFASKPVDWRGLSQEIARVLGLSVGSGGVSAEPEQPGELPEVLNYDAGLRRWSGHVEAYGKALAQFAHVHREAGATLALQLDEGDRAGTRALAHKLGGVAANLGLEQLSAGLARLEQACVAGDEALLPALTEAAGAELAAALDAIAALPAQAEQQAAVAAAGLPDPERVRESATRLQQALRRGALDDAALSNLAQALAGHAATAQLAAIQSALADFDFARAETRVAALLADLAPQT